MGSDAAAELVGAVNKSALLILCERATGSMSAADDVGGTEAGLSAANNRVRDSFLFHRPVRISLCAQQGANRGSSEAVMFPWSRAHGPGGSPLVAAQFVGVLCSTQLMTNAGAPRATTPARLGRLAGDVTSAAAAVRLRPCPAGALVSESPCGGDPGAARQAGGPRSCTGCSIGFDGCE